MGTAVGAAGTLVSRTEFNDRLRADIVAAPQSVAGIGWAGPAAGWLLTGHSLSTGSVRLPAVLRHLERALHIGADTPHFWLLCCIQDGWRERVAHSSRYAWVDPPADLDDQVEWRGAPGTLPRMSPSRDWVACFCAHHDDPSAVLLPEAHYLMYRWYWRIRARLATERRPWPLRADRASYAGGDHAVDSPNTPGPQLRRELQALADRGDLPLDVTVGGAVSRRRQLHDKYLIDVDGFVRTWDAWAWKMLSGSVVLSPDSVWQTRFTQQFEAWQHYVPLAADLSDLAERLDWCRRNDDECRAMSRRARRHALEVYDHRRVERATAALLRPRLGWND